MQVHYWSIEHQLAICKYFMIGYDKCMPQHETTRRSPCPISLWLELLGDKWTLLIIRDLLFAHKNTYSEFLSSEEKISTNILADRLKKLEVEGFVTKSVDEKNKSKYIYRLTGKSIDLLPMLLEMISWTSKYVKDTDTPKEFLKQLENNRDGLIKQLKESHK